MSENDNKNINNEENTNVNENNEPNTENTVKQQNVSSNPQLLSEEEEKKKKVVEMLLILLPMAAIVIFIFIGLITMTCTFGHKWGEDATCETPQICERCGEIGEPALGHDWIDATCTEPKTCSRCGKTDAEPLGHKIENPTVTKVATCTEAGEETGTCSVCHQDVTETIPATGHSLGQWEIGTQATLNSAGEKVQKCTVCGQIINKDSYELTYEEKQAIRKQQQAEQERQRKQQEQQKLKNSYPITILSQDVTYMDYDNEYRYSIKFRIKNNSSTDASIITVRGTLCDSSGAEITSNETYIYDLPASQSKEREVYIRDSRSGLHFKDLEIVS